MYIYIDLDSNKKKFSRSLKNMSFINSFLIFNIFFRIYKFFIICYSMEQHTCPTGVKDILDIIFIFIKKNKTQNCILSILSI